MANSSYYGSTGSSVKQMQTQLNGMGAGLKVDGVWGPLTEAAYQKFMSAPATGASGAYSSAQSSAYSASPNTSALFNMPSYTPLQVKLATDDELLAQSKNLIGAQYDLLLDNERRKTEETNLLLQQSIERLGPQYEARLEALRDAFDTSRQQVNDQALSRGMGRSSHVMNQISKTYDQQRAQEDNALSYHQAQVNGINEQMDLLKRQLLDTENTLSAAREKDILRQLEVLRGERDRQMLEVQRYNNELQVKQMEANMRAQELAMRYEQQMREYEFEQQKWAQQMQLQSAKSSSGGKSASSSSATAYATLMSGWNQLADAGKLSYFSANAQQLALVSPKAYEQMQKEVKALSSKGVTSTVNYAYNYWNSAPAYTGFIGGR